MKIARTYYLVLPFLATLLSTGCRSLFVKSAAALHKKNYEGAVAISEKVLPTDEEYAGAQFVAAQAYYERGDFLKAKDRCEACLDASREKLSRSHREELSEDDAQYSLGFNNEILADCDSFYKKIDHAIEGLPENLEKRRLEAEESQKRQLAYEAEEQAKKDAAAKEAVAMRPFWEKAKKILSQTINLRSWFERDERMSEVYRPEESLELVAGPSDEPHCVNVAVHLVPKKNWKSIRMDTTVSGGASPTQARGWSKDWKPTADTVWATFKVDVKKGTIQGVDSWAKTVLSAYLQEKEQGEYFQGR